MNDYSIFDLLNQDSNDQISKMNKNDKLELLILINKFFLEYRKKIKLNKKTTFGVEIEFENKNIGEIKYDDIYKNINSWRYVSEYSVDSGGELVSPILYDSKKKWETLKEKCHELQSNAKILNKASNHIHVGANILSKKEENIKNITKLWYAYEDIIYRFGYGEYLNYRPNIYAYAQPLRNSSLNIQRQLKYFDYLDFLYQGTRNKSLNFKNTMFKNIKYKNTIEVRCPNGTLNEIIIQNNVNFFTKLFTYGVSEDCDIDRLNSLISKIELKDVDLDNFNLIDINRALELSDLIFDNNLDKIYFLRQYLKNFDITNYYKKAKPFTYKSSVNNLRKCLE